MTTTTQEQTAADLAVSLATELSALEDAKKKIDAQISATRTELTKAVQELMDDERLAQISTEGGSSVNAVGGFKVKYERTSRLNVKDNQMLDAVATRYAEANEVDLMRRAFDVLLGLGSLSWRKTSIEDMARGASEDQAQAIASAWSVKVADKPTVKLA